MAAFLLVATLVLAGGFCAWVYYRREFGVRSRPMLLAARLVAVAGVVALLWNPLLPAGPRGDAPDRYAILDASASMAARAQDGTPLWETAVERALAEARGGARLLVAGRGQGVRAIDPDSLSGITPTGVQSLLAEAVAVAAEGRRPRGGPDHRPEAARPRRHRTRRPPPGRGPRRRRAARGGRQPGHWPPGPAGLGGERPGSAGQGRGRGRVGRRLGHGGDQPGRPAAPDAPHRRAGPRRHHRRRLHLRHPPRGRAPPGRRPPRRARRLRAGRRARRRGPGRSRGDGRAAGLVRARLGAALPAPRARPGDGSSGARTSPHRPGPLPADGRRRLGERRRDRPGRHGPAAAPRRNGGGDGRGRIRRRAARGRHDAHLPPPDLPARRGRGGGGGGWRRAGRSRASGTSTRRRRRRSRARWTGSRGPGCRR